ncbi:MAG: hypothetical protein WCA35_30325 [Kovacikia sp.]
MMKKWAIAVGINQYQFFQPLSYAQQDAQALKAFLVHEAGFAPDRCIVLSDTSPPLWGKPTYPSHENIQGWIDLLTQQYLQPGDLLWVFFGGYGVCWQGKDYLIPIEGNPENLPGTAIPLESLFKQLKETPAETALLLLDMTRSEGSLPQGAIGSEASQLASTLGIPTILSCQPGVFSRESSFLGHGFLTTALIEGLRHQPDITLAELDHYLKERVPQLSELYLRPIQQPLALSPSDKIHQPLFLAHPVSTASWNHSARSNVPITQERGASTLNDRATLSKTPETSKNVASQQTILPSGENGSVARNGSASGKPGQGHIPSNIPLQIPLSENGRRQAADTSPPTKATLEEATEAATEIQTMEDSLLGRSLWWGGVAAATFLLASGVFLKNWTSMTVGSSMARKPTLDASGRIASNAKSQTIAALPTSQSQPEQSLPTSANAISAQSDSLPIQRSVTAPINHLAEFSVSQPLNRPSSPTSGQAKPASPQEPDDNLDDSRPASFSTAKTQGSLQKLSPSQSILNDARAKIAINSNQASLYWYAIQDASQIKPEDPQYQQAQQEIAGWSQDILTIANWRAQQRSFDTAIMAAALIPSGQPHYTEAQQAIKLWCPALAKQSKKNRAPRKQANIICLKY